MRWAAPQWPKLIAVLKRGGRYTCSTVTAGPMVELDRRKLYLRDLTFTGSTGTPHRTFTNAVSCIEKGEIRPALAAVCPLEQLKEAQAAFIAKMHTGDITVIP